jgi:acyl-[acyl-carrier-protein]-phospholipid O-acyltransferase / long-chain-fatty-acid--[acyl-carrier-protein] ligase
MINPSHPERVSALALLRDQKFLPLFVTQLLGAINDNLFKNALVVLALYRLAHLGPVLVALAGGIFLLPYAIFSAMAGQLADAREKSRLIRAMKIWELGLMLLAGIGFFTGNFTVLLAVLFGLGVQATFFSPLKYGILPDFFAGDALVTGNGLIEAGTFVGILLGTVAGGLLVVLPHGEVAASFAVLVVAVAGILAAWAIPQTPVAQPGLRLEWNFFSSSVCLLRLAAEAKTVWFAVLGISWFWTMGTIVLAEFPTLARDVLHGSGAVVTLMLGVFAVGVGIGSLGVARLVRGKALLHYVVACGFGVSVFTACFALLAAYAPVLPDIPAVLSSGLGQALLADLLALAICGGGFSVPLYVLLQQCAAPSHRARMVGANNIMNALASVAGAGLTAGLYAGGLGASKILLLSAVANGGVTFWVLGKIRFGAKNDRKVMESSSKR